MIKKKFGFTKSKAYGLCGAVLATAVFATHANADEQTAPTATQVSVTAVSDVTETAPTATAVEVTSKIPTTVPSDTTQDNAKEVIDKSQDTLKDTVKNGTDKGVEVTNTGTTDVVIDENNKVDKTNEVLKDLNEQDKKIQEATQKQQENQVAYDSSKEKYDEAVKVGQEKLDNSTKKADEQIKLATDNDLTVNVTTEKSSPNYIDVKGLTGSKLIEAMNKNIALYNEAVQKGVAKQDIATSKMQQLIDSYLKALADYKNGVASNTGLKWIGGTTVEAGSNTQKMTGNEQVVNFGDGTLKVAAMYATQGANLDQNIDANFDNIFRIDGTAEIWIRNTSNGDVRLTFSDVNSPYNTGTFVAIYGANDGGIAWSVFALYNGQTTGSSGESGGGYTGGASGNILNYVYSYNGTVKTMNNVSVVTFNDIDNNQTVTTNGDLNGVTAENGSNVSSSGNSYSAGFGDVSQGSNGNLSSNGVRWSFEDPKQVEFSYTHSTSGKNSSIVGGVFGVDSAIPKEPKKPVLEALKVDVEMPKAPEVPENQKVDVHYYNFETTPTPTPTPTPVQSMAVLPMTGEKSSGLTIIFGFIMAFMGGAYLKRKTKDSKDM